MHDQVQSPGMLQVPPGASSLSVTLGAVVTRQEQECDGDQAVSRSDSEHTMHDQYQRWCLRHDPYADVCFLWTAGASDEIEMYNITPEMQAEQHGRRHRKGRRRSHQETDQQEGDQDERSQDAGDNNLGQALAVAATAAAASRRRRCSDLYGRTLCSHK